MASFVSKILEHAGQLERKTLHENIDVLMQKCNDLELEVYNFAESKLTSFDPCLSTAEILNHKVNEVENHIYQVESKINNEIKEQLTSSTGEFQSLTRQLEEAKIKAKGLDYLSSLFQVLKNSEEALNNRNFSDVILALNHVDILLQQPLCDQDDRINILGSVKSEASDQRIKAQTAFADAWADYIKWNVQTDPDSPHQPSDDSSNVTEVSISVASNDFDGAALKQLVEGLHMSNMLTYRMKSFSNQFQKYIVPFLIEPSSVVVEMRNSGPGQTLVIKQNPSDGRNNKGNKGKSKEKVNIIPENELYKVVFDHLVTILEHLHTMLLHAEFGWQDKKPSSCANLESKELPNDIEKGTLMGLLGQEISPWLLDFLIRDIIAKAVPTSAKDLEGFEKVTSATRSVQDKLISLGLISSEDLRLQESVKNVNLLFCNKKSILLLEEVRSLLMSDLMNETVAVTDGKPMGDWPMLSSNLSNKKARKIESMAENFLSENTFRMPECRISLNIQLLMSMAYETLMEATESSQDCANQMFYSVHAIFELFTDVVQTHHGRNIQMFPQMAALHHNNCMFIAHHLMTLGHQFAPKLQMEGAVTFVDLIPKIRASGVALYRDQVLSQRHQVLESLDGAEGFSCVEEESNHRNAERAIKQAILQLQHLQKVWQSILPINVYRKTMGNLLQSLVERLTDCITSLEDIAEEAAKNLTSIIELVEKEMASLMAVAPAELIRHVQNWTHLTNVKTVLNASLLRIGDLWSEGKGPLALTFAPAEMKTMIRALFQNTDRRAAILASIK